MRISTDKSGTTIPSLGEDGVTEKEEEEKRQTGRGVTSIYHLDQIFQTSTFVSGTFPPSCKSVETGKCFGNLYFHYSIVLSSLPSTEVFGFCNLLECSLKNGFVIQTSHLHFSC